MIGEIQSYLGKIKVKAEIEGRSKHLYSIYRKMESKNLEFDQIYDLMGREVLREKMNAHSNFASSKVELLDTPAGHYVVKIVTATGVYTEEFVIQ